MADIDGSGSGLDVAAATPAEQQVLAQVPADASGDAAALDAKIADAASSVMGANLNDPRFKTGVADDTATGGVGSADAAGAANAGNGTGTEGGAEGAGDSKTEPAAEVTGQPEAAPKPSDQGAEQAPKVEAAPVVAKDYTLTVQGADTVDADGKTVPGQEYKVSKIEDLPEDFTPRNNRQVFEIIRDLDKLEQTKAKDDAQAATVAEQTAVQEAQAKTLDSWDKEITAMQKAGIIPEAKLKETDPNYLKDPAMVKVTEVFAFMEKTNNARRAAGNPNLIRSFEDAYEKMDRADRIAKEAQAAKEEAETAKLKASVVGGGTARSGAAEAPVYVAGQAGGDIRNLK